MKSLIAAVAFGLVASVTAAQPVREPPVGQTPAPPRTDLTFLASAVLPGAAQFLAGDDRWVPYAAAEAWALLSWAGHRREAHDFERRYRDLAWRVARRISAGPRVDGDFEYYEAMTHFRASGAFDADPGVEGVQPERQVDTFNGDLWELSKALYGATSSTTVQEPAYQAALAYYQSLAIRPEFAWAWGGSRLEQQAFAGLIADSDAAFRDATRYLGLVFANHIVSAVDALITARLRELAGRDVRLRGGPDSDGWEYGVRVPVGR